MCNAEELIIMLKILKEQALKSCKDTAVIDVNIDSFKFVIDEAIEALEQQPSEDKKLHKIDQARMHPEDKKLLKLDFKSTYRQCESLRDLKWQRFAKK